MKSKDKGLDLKKKNPTSPRGSVCEYCRLKKVRCDRKRPKCSKCELKGLDCCYLNATRPNKKKNILQQAAGKLPNIPVGIIGTVEGNYLATFLEKCFFLKGLFDFSLVQSALQGKILGSQTNSIYSSPMLIMVCSSKDIQVLSAVQRCTLLMSIAAGLFLEWDRNASSYFTQAAKILRSATEAGDVALYAWNFLSLFSILMGDLEKAQIFFHMVENGSSSSQLETHYELSTIVQNILIVINAQKSQDYQIIQSMQNFVKIFPFFGQDLDFKSFFRLQQFFSDTLVSRDLHDLKKIIPICYQAVDNILNTLKMASQPSLFGQLYCYCFKSLLSVGLACAEETKLEIQRFLSFFHENALIGILFFRINPHMVHLMIHLIGALEMNELYDNLQKRVNRLVPQCFDFPLLPPISSHGFCDDEICSKGMLWIHSTLIQPQVFPKDYPCSKISPSGVFDFPAFTFPSSKGSQQKIDLKVTTHVCSDEES